jgi:hypothetical protein
MTVARKSIAESWARKLRGFGGGKHHLRGPYRPASQDSKAEGLAEKSRTVGPPDRHLNSCSVK